MHGKTSVLAPDDLQIKIVALVADFEAALKTARDRIPGIFRKLCALAQIWQLDAEQFRSRLVRAGLPHSRASEIKSVLSVAGIRTAFIEGKISWRKALPEARERLRAGEHFGAVEELAAQIVSTMHRNGLSEFQTQYGTFTLHPLEFSLGREHNG